MPGSPIPFCIIELGEPGNEASSEAQSCETAIRVGLHVRSKVDNSAVNGQTAEKSQSRF